MRWTTSTEWLLRDRIDGRDGWTIVDCGVDSAATRAAWEQMFTSALDGRPVLRVRVTHMHPDHIGLAHWLCERWTTPQLDCRLWIGATDWNAARVAHQASTGFGGDGAARFFALHGLSDPAALNKVRQRSSDYASLVPQVPRQSRRLMDGMDGMDVQVGGHGWRCIVGHGHAPEHIALHCQSLGVLIAGDMVLPRISTNVSVIDIDIDPEADPLPLYLASIEHMRTVPADTLVLPSHGKPFTGLHVRIGQLQAHREERYAEVVAACSDHPCSAAGRLA